MRYLILFLFFPLTPLSSKAQKELNLGEVSYDSLFNCNDSFRNRLNERLFNVPVICDSKNDIEIRLSEFSRPGGTRQFIILSYKDGKWDAKKYMNSIGKLGRKQTVISLDLSIYDGMYPEYHPCIQILNHLVENKIFLIPDQSKDIPSLTHAAYFILSYKTNDIFRAYYFRHPDVYFQEHPSNDNKEYLYLKEIIKTLQEMFDNI